jgi:putative endonuclease
LDLVVLDRETVVFVEVKFRAERDPGGPLLAVGAKKREDTARAAARWLSERRLFGRPVRFDVIGVTWGSDGTELRVQHVPNAFPGGRRQFY